MNIVITGASSGIGAALYKGFKKEEGVSVTGLSRRGPDIKYDLRSFSNPKSTFPFDLLPNSIDLLINAAGIMPFEESEDVFTVNFWGTYNMIQMAHPYMVNGSCIINIASVSGMVGEPELPVYASSKAAILSLTKSLARRWAPMIRVNAISPGFYNTNLVQGLTPDDLLEKVPMKYESDPDELYLVVEMIYKTKYMTGANIVVDGGISA